MNSKNTKSLNEDLFETCSLYPVYERLPEFVQEEFRNLRKDYPSLSEQTLELYEGMTKQIQLESVLQVDSSGTYGEIVQSEMARATDKARENLQKSTVQTTATARRWNRALQEDGAQFTRELLKALNSSLMFHSEDSTIPDSLKFLVLNFIEQTTKEDEILNGNNKVTESTRKAISVGLDKLRPIGISHDTKIPLSTSLLPYPFIEDINSEKICQQIHKILIHHQKIKCSRKEFSKHLVYGELSNKITWYGKDIELALMHKVMQGGTKDARGKKILKTKNIHKLAEAHFVKSDGQEFKRGALNSGLARVYSLPSHYPFLSELSHLLKC